MASIEGKKIVVGVTGGIAAYKAVEVVSRLRKAGAEVHVIMTRAAQEFVTELTFRELSGQPVTTDMWSKVTHFKVEHIALANLADMVVIVPATANIIAKLAAGIADDMLTTTVLATKAPLLLAPAMNTNMYENPITQQNIAELKTRGALVIEPATGQLACGTSGKGRLEEPIVIVEAIKDYFTDSAKLAGKKILITAGGTIEPIDPVRFIGNHSTGRMGYAIARAACKLGADVTLISGPSTLSDIAGVKNVRIDTAIEMQQEVMSRFADTDAVIMSAAVADYRPQAVAKNKIKKSDGELTLKLTRNPDILYELGQQKKEQILVGFAAETCKLDEYAKGKLVKKNLDFIVANDVSQADAGFGTLTNRVKIFDRDGENKAYPLMSKEKLANVILTHLAKKYLQLVKKA